jgi:DNA mismatch repair ATPase MutL
MNSWGRTGVSSVKGGLHGQESGKKTRSGRASGRQAYPAFVLNLRCQFSEYDITFEVSKTIVEFKDWSKVLSFLNDVLEASWEQGLTAKQSAGELDLHLCFPWQCHHHVPSFPILACYILS